MGTIVSLIGWVLFGLIAGWIARLIHPGRDDMGLGATILLGVCGSLLGGGIAYVLGIYEAFEPGSWIMAILGAILLLALGVFGSRSRKAAKS